MINGAKSANLESCYVLDEVELIGCYLSCTLPGKWRICYCSPDLWFVDGGKTLGYQETSYL